MTEGVGKAEKFIGAPYRLSLVSEMIRKKPIRITISTKYFLYDKGHAKCPDAFSHLTPSDCV